jgi:hypothetical protein
MDNKLTEHINRMNGVLEDIGAEVGYTATNALVDWFGGGNLHIPTAASEDHPIAKVIGLSAMKRLVKLYEGCVGNQRMLWVPLGYEREIARRDRMIALLFAQGYGTKAITSVTGMSERHVQQVRVRIENLGLLPLILRQAGLHENGGG